MSVLLSIISVGATVASVCMLASPVLTVLNLVKARSIGIMTITFFCAQYMNCVVWSLYGVQQRAIPVMACNSLGTAIATYCVLTFLTVARVEERSGLTLKSTTYRATLLTVVAVGGLAFGFLALILILVNAQPTVATLLNGVCGGCTSVIMLSSPLGMAKGIIKNKNAEGLQPLTMTFGTLNSILWTLYGILVGDPFIFVPNALCTLACLFQFYLLLRYGRRPMEAVDVSEAVPSIPIEV